MIILCNIIVMDTLE